MMRNMVITAIQGAVTFFCFHSNGRFDLLLYYEKKYTIERKRRETRNYTPMKRRQHQWRRACRPEKKEQAWKL